MMNNHLHRFLITAQWRSLLFKLTFPFSVYLIVFAVLVLFADDVLLPVSIRGLLFILLLGFLPFFSAYVLKKRRSFQNLTQFKPLETEKILKDWSELSSTEIYNLLNVFYLPKSVQANQSIFFRPINTKEKKKLIIILLGFIFLLATIFISTMGFHDLMLPFSQSYHLKNFEYVISPKTKKLERGDSLTIRVTFKESQLPVYLEITDENGRTEKIESLNGNPITVQKPNIQQSLSYRLKNDWFQSDTYEITVIDRPFVQNLKISVTPPKYTGIKSFEQSSTNGNSVQFPEGSFVRLYAQFSKPIISATLTGWKNKPISISNSIFSDQEPVFSSKRINFSILDRDSLTNRDTTSFHLLAVADQIPTLQVLEPSESTPFVNRNFQIPIRLSAMDDYGIDRILIRYRILSKFNLIEPKFKELVFQKNSQPIPNLTSNTVWQFPDRTLTDGDWIEMQIGAADTYPYISGGHVVWSSTIQLKVPDINQLYQDTDKQTSDMIKDLDNLTKKSKELSDKIKKTTDDIKKKSGNLTFAEEQKIKQLDNEVTALKNELEKTQKSMDQSFQQLNQNQTLSPETLQKYMELQELLQETKSEKLQALLQKLQNDISLLDRKEVQQALDQLQINNDAVNSQLDKSIKAIKRLQNEQKIEEMVQRAEELLQRQMEIQKETQTEKPDMNKISSLQNLQTKKLEEFQKLTTDVKKNAETSDEKKFIQSQLDKIEKQAHHENLTEQSQSIEKSANQNISPNSTSQTNQKQQVQKQTQDLSNKLTDLKNQTQQLQQSMKENQNLITLNLLRSLMIKSNKWSELVGAEFPSKDQTQWGASYTESLLQSLKTIQDSATVISEREPQLGMLITKDLYDVRDHLTQSKDAYVNNQFSFGEVKRTQSRAQMNAAIYRILSLMNKSNNQGQSGSGTEQEKSFLQEMQELANRQQDLNQQTLNEQAEQQQSGTGQMSQQRLAQMAAQQAAIRQQLQQLMEKSQQKGGNSGFSTDMSMVEKEMDKAAEEISRGIDSKLIERQQKILSRMLESQRSTIQREFEDKRESFANKVLYKTTDKELKYDVPTLQEYFILNSQLNNYPESYRRFIRSYFQQQTK